MSATTIGCPIETCLALTDLVTAYCHAVDAIGDVAGVVGLFAPDAVYDLIAMGLGEIVGHEAIGGFFAAAFPTMAHNAHYATNVLVTAWDPAGTATVSSYVQAFSLGKDGTLLTLRGRYTLDCRQIDGAWRIARLGMALLLPL